jgi:hypothetical protein
MPRRGISALLSLLAVVLSGCLVAACSLTGSLSGSLSGRTVVVHDAAYEHGLAAGEAARHGHRFGRHHTYYDVASFCVKTAFKDIQKMNGSLLDWTEGFEKGCRTAR